MVPHVIRPAGIDDAHAMARVHVDTWRATYAGIVPDEHLRSLSYDRCAARWVEALSDPAGGTHAFVAEARPGGIVALASGGPLQEPLDPFDGELYVLYVLQSFQRTGCGTRLVNRVARDLAARGYHSLVIWVLKDNPACHFYERLGGRRTAEKIVEIGGQALLDVAYTWPDLALFGHD
ncbi:MAG: GNAT family N-acetyltransferase [Anaerolineae bacterium]|nr:GNAT family N-acetyltransferase [Anaerolineae bacterium]